MVYISGGTFLMGSPDTEAERWDDEGPQHSVTVSGFFMGIYEVTQGEYRAVMGNNPSYFTGDNLPVETVSWYDAIAYCNALSRREGLTPAYRIDKSRRDPHNQWDYDDLKWTVTWNRAANGYRLPTEAEWEYACRAGTTTPFNTGNNITTSQANYDGNSPYAGNPTGTYRGTTTAVGSFSPNSWGLYDMHGNLWEWCWDWYGSYVSGSQTDPEGAVSGAYRVKRGGSWGYDGQFLRSADRLNYGPSVGFSGLGFRLVRSAPSPTPDMVRISGGTFTMGSPDTEPDSYNDERPQHSVTVSGFFMGIYEVTQGEYRAVMGNNPSYFTGDNLPVETVSWYDAIAYCNALSRREGLTPAYTRSGDTVTWNRGANGYRLPTEAEWEYACRAGTTTPYYTGSSVDNAGWYRDNSEGTTHPVGQKQANAWGLYDMHGNVWEWCWDWYGSYANGPQTDPQGALAGADRVLRGGSWIIFGQYLRSADRFNYYPSRGDGYLGFRLVRSDV
jgi:formylglycine-generating enzyme required for sulfatase activity